jgi:lysyl-tRNA synthetase, class II
MPVFYNLILNMAENDSNEFHNRLQKLSTLRESGVTPYADRFDRSHNAKEALAEGEKAKLREVDAIVKKPVKKLMSLCGRIMTMRAHGKLSFAHLQDFSGKLQICFMMDLMGKDDYKFLKKLDVADHIGVEGELFKTRHGEVTLMVYKVTLLSKTLRPLPEKWHGIKDQEKIYRQRYLDTTMNRESMDRFVFRSNLVKELREFYWSEGFMEIETPVLENVSSGAAARPFSTHHNALDIDVYLRIAAGELWQKTAVVGGFEKTFEVARCFRNEGMDPSHLQEFSMVEHYAAYWNYEDNMNFTERMFEYLLKKLLGTMKIKTRDRDGKEVVIDFKTPWPRLKFTELIKKDSGIDVLEFEDDAKGLLTEIKKKKIAIEDAGKMGYGNLVDALYKKVSRPKLIQPAFVIQHPKSTKPLSRINDKDPRLCDTFQLLVNTWEIINAYGEIVDPIDQRERFESQAMAKAGGDEEAMMMNEEYLLAMEHGMPCMSGWGMGIDRLVTLLNDQDNLKDSVLFPLLRPLDEMNRKNQKAYEKAKKKLKKK